MATSNFDMTSPFSEEGYKQMNFGNDDYVMNRFLEQQHGLSSLSLSNSNGSSSQKPLGVVLFGVGRMGSVHLGGIARSNSMRLKYIVEENTDKWESIRNSFGLGPEVKFLGPDRKDVALFDDEVDACFIVTTTSTHEELVMASLKAGKHVFCEKPLASTTAGVRQCYKLAKEKGKVLLCAFNRRFDPAYQDIYERVMRGQVGRVQVARSISRDSPTNPWEYLRTSGPGGIFFDSACHDIDLMAYFMGELPIKVYAAGSRFHDEYKNVGDYDTISVTLHFPSGALGNIEIVRHCSFGHDQRFEVFGADGMLTAENQTPLGSRLWDRSGMHTPRTYLSSFSRYWEAYQGEKDHFVEAIRSKSNKVIITGEMVLAVTKVCQACSDSAETGLPVNLEWSQEEVPEAFTMKRLE